MKTNTSITKATAARRAAHHRALASLHATPSKADDPQALGLKMWRALRRLERIANDAATAQCNGETYRTQPFREDSEWEAFKGQIKATAKHIFGGTLPKGFFINTDPSGYALKINPERGVVPAGLHQDFGGYGCLAAEIS
jgi:hypothetical protein